MKHYAAERATAVQDDAVFVSFTERRSRLMQRLDASRLQVDDWIGTHMTKRANVTELAQLEGLLAERRTMLDELVKLDDSLLEHLVVLLRRDGSKPQT